MKRLIRIFAALAIICPAAGCAKGYTPMDNADVDPDEYNLIIAGYVVDQTTSDPLPGITVTLKSAFSLSSDPQISTGTSTNQDGMYQIRQRFNAPAYQMIHSLEFTDGTLVHKPHTMEITVHRASFSLSAHGYYFPGVNVALSRQ
jgi:hypothetical protein